eukprot:590561-Rhodomonas_salina.2
MEFGARAPTRSRLLGGIGAEKLMSCTCTVPGRWVRLDSDLRRKEYEEGGSDRGPYALPTRCPVLNFSITLRTPYAISRSDPRYSLHPPHAMSSKDSYLSMECPILITAIDTPPNKCPRLT